MRGWNGRVRWNPLPKRTLLLNFRLIISFMVSIEAVLLICYKWSLD